MCRPANRHARMTRPDDDPEEEDFAGDDVPDDDIPEEDVPDDDIPDDDMAGDDVPGGDVPEDEVPVGAIPDDGEGLDLDLDDGDDGEDGEEEEGEGGEEESGAPAEGTASKAKKSKVRGAKDAEPDPGDPETKVPTKKKMLAALEWAFAEEEDVSPELLERFADHALAMLETNKVMSLTAIQDPKEVAAKHFLDSWRLTRLLPLIARKVLDLGSGAGFPGLPLAMAEPNVSMTLIDSTRKKAEFLQGLIAELGVSNVRAVWDRAEDYLTTERVDVVVVRAVSSVRENIRTVRKVRHSLKDMVMLKGSSWSREVRAAEREAERLGFKLDTVWEHELPGEMGQRAVLVYRAPGGAGL